MSDLMNEFLATGTIRRKTVHLYADQEAADELAALAKQANEAQDDDVVAALAEAWDSAKARWEASRADVTVVRLTDAIREQLDVEVPFPTAPREAGKGATEKRIKEAKEAAEQWAAEVLEVGNERSRLSLLYGIERFEFRGKVLERALDKNGKVAEPAVSQDDLDAMFAAPYGPQWKNILTAAFNEVSTLGAEPDAPFSPANSGSDPA